MIRIEESKQLGGTTGIFIVAVELENSANVRIYENITELDVMSQGYKIIRKCQSREEAENVKRKYENINSCFIVRETPQGIKLQKFDGVLTTAPIGTLGIFRKKKLAKRFLYEKKNVKKKEKERKEKAASSNTTAVA